MKNLIKPVEDLETCNFVEIGGNVLK